jgi:hypothetical protein
VFLLCFEAVSGLKINLSKSEIVHVGDVGDIEGLANILRSIMASLPMKYLDIPLGASYKASTIWKWNIVWRARRSFIYLREAG